MINDILENSFNHLLQTDSHSKEKIAALAGKSVGIDLLNTPLQWMVSLSHDGIEVTSGLVDQADCVLRGTPFAMIRYLNAEQVNPSTNKLLGIEIEGDLEFAREFSAILRKLDIDWEEVFSQIIGDFPAQQLSKVFTSLRSEFNRSTDSARQHFKYIVTERMDQLVMQDEVEKFYDEIDSLSLRVERLERKINNLKLTKDNA